MLYRAIFSFLFDFLLFIFHGQGNLLYRFFISFLSFPFLVCFKSDVFLIFFVLCLLRFTGFFCTVFDIFGYLIVTFFTTDVVYRVFWSKLLAFNFYVKYFHHFCHYFSNIYHIFSSLFVTFFLHFIRVFWSKLLVFIFFFSILFISFTISFLKCFLSFWFSVCYIFRNWCSFVGFSVHKFLVLSFVSILFISFMIFFFAF